jgi:hypothetical protein
VGSIVTPTTFNDLRRRLLSTVEPKQTRCVAIGPGFDAGDRTIHAVYRSSPSEPSSDGLERIGYLLVSDSRSEFVRTSRGPELWVVGVAAVTAAIALGAVLWHWLRAE